MLVSGVDDGYFPLKYKGRKGKTVLMSVVFDNYEIVDIDFDFIYVDGEEAGDVLRTLKKGEISILDGVTFGGFNYVNPFELDFKYIIFYSSKPNLKRVSEALSKHFNDSRKDVILNVMNNLTRLTTKRGDIYVYSNIETKEVVEVIEKYQVFDKLPEPLKTAHELSSSLSRFLLSKNLI
ncbi:MAG: DUF99 family protein [Sulfolobus sp.]|nr:DUF99 family protein [Sulfolobus sp.]